MAKQCNAEEGCSNPVFSNGFCGWHQYLRTDNKWISSLEKKSNKSITKKRKAINPVSDKRLSELAEYRPIRDKYLLEHPICEVKGCGERTKDLHHKAKRGRNLSNIETFMAVCRCCHTWIHSNPEESWLLGYLI